MSEPWKKHNLKLHKFEQNLVPKQYKVIAGVDEVGRGPLAGPVVACAVVLKKRSFTTKICDSKYLSLNLRHKAFEQIVANADIGIGIVDEEVIDQTNILRATVLAMSKAVESLEVKPEYLLIDGRFAKNSFFYPHQTVIGGDGRCLSIAAASIAAKVFRDSILSSYAGFYPEYGFEHNRGYGTKKHIQAIKRFGPSPIHRRTFRPVSGMY